jgi:hypothetical protein
MTGIAAAGALGVLPSAIARTAVVSAGAFMLATCVGTGFGASTGGAGRTLTSGFVGVTRAFCRSEFVLGAGAITAGGL